MIDRSSAPTFEIGKVYDRWPEINEPYGGSRQSGISPSSRTAAIFLFTGETGEQYGYEDEFDDDGVFSYVGEGQVGDMKCDRGNRAIIDHAKDGRALHLFKSLGKGKGQEYLGEFVYANHSIRVGLDRDRNSRKLIVFHLVPVSLVSDDADHPLIDEAEAKTIFPSSIEDARKRAINAFQAAEGTAGRSALRTLYQRSKRVRDYVLLRAGGKCECCKRPAPFARPDGSPYLEPHHTTRVSDGGLDHPRFVAAICPTCHREIHHGRDGDSKNAALIAHLKTIEADV